MSRQRLLLLVSGALLTLVIIGAILGSIFRLLNEIRYYLEYFLPYWLVSPVLLLTVILVIAVSLQVGLPWLRRQKEKRLTNKRNHSEKPTLPKNRRQAAQQSLKSIDQLLDRLQDNVARQGLLKERERIAKELARGDLVVVIFGTGSSGKTSLIRALLNEIVGDVAASMGSTNKSQVYRLRLKSLHRGLQLIDTPGILEAGKDGFSREKEAKQRAGRADLMVVVVDGDLRAEEWEIIRSLCNLGKRLLLVLNKCDLRGEQEERKLVSVLRGRCKGLIKAEDVVKTSASPQSIPRLGKRPWQPPPEIGDLLNRLAIVLHEDGEELLADNILLQCRHIGDTGRSLLDRQRQKEARNCVDRYSWISGGVVAVTPLPGIDLLGTAAVNAQMVMEIAKIYGLQLNRSRAQELAVSVGRTLAGLGIVKGGVGLIGTALRVNLPTALVGLAIQGVASAWLTRIAGASFIAYFQQDQDWGAGGVPEVVQRHYDLNRRDSSLEKFLETALRKVVDPLRQEKRRELPPRSWTRMEEDSLDHEHPEP